MAYRSLGDSVLDLERAGRLVRVREEVDPYLEMAEIQRRAYVAGAPALLFENVKGCRFRAVSNLFGTMDRCRFLFRHTLERVKKIVELKAHPASFWRSPLRFASAPLTAAKSLPRRVRGGPVLAETATIDQLPQIHCWPGDGGPFITLPQVLTEDPERPGLTRSNLGMYRVQLSGGEYRTNREVGLHYQIHRGIGVHHAAAVRRGEPLRASVFVGGPPAHTLAAVMPLPEGLSELLFAGMLGGRRFRYTRRDGHVISSEAEFCITGTIDPKRTLPEGPFGDHLGYYSLEHPFPVLEVQRVFHRKDAIWPFTVVGRPPQEDTSFGELIHEITRPMVPVELPGLHALHAVDAAGVHPLLLAIGSERYVPYGERVPQEILTVANALLGFGQCSLAKYLIIVAREDAPDLDIHRVDDFLRHALERVDWSRDLHFQTRTTMDTLDYSGTALNEGSKLVVAAAGRRKRELACALPDDLRLPADWPQAALALPGVLVVEGRTFPGYDLVEREMEELAGHLGASPALDGLPLVVVVDDAAFTARSLRNFLWVTFTRSNPSHDVHGVESFTEHKHWGCRRSLIIDARLKPHHAAPLVEDAAVAKKVDALATPGKSLYGIL
ncbi:MAG: UbiD family decarboxylase [Planctomycetota bacterium]|nr:UbiD family decarboxylase [Planctomycetota bacterium]